jgi:hypothetical protein
MSCPHLERTSALFDGVDDDEARAHADTCAECRAFLDDAAHLRNSLRSLEIPELNAPARVPFWRRRIAIPVPVFLAILTIVVWSLWPRDPRSDAAGAFAGLDGGGRAAISVRPQESR